MFFEILKRVGRLFSKNLVSPVNRPSAGKRREYLMYLVTIKVKSIELWNRKTTYKQFYAYSMLL